MFGDIVGLMNLVSERFTQSSNYQDSALHERLLRKEHLLIRMKLHHFGGELMLEQLQKAGMIL